MPERRSHPRRKVVLPVKVSAGNNAPLLAYTMDLTCKGARIAGLRDQLAVGSIIKLLRGAHKASFRVIWVQALAANLIQAGLEAVDASDSFWGVDFEALEKTTQRQMDALLQLLKSSKLTRKLGP